MIKVLSDNEALMLDMEGADCKVSVGKYQFYYVTEYSTMIETPQFDLDTATLLLRYEK